MRTFQNSKNASMDPSSNKITNRSFRNNLTDRIMNTTNLVKAQNYFTDNEQYLEQRDPIKQN